jgi:hypothetical protein
LVNNLSSEVKTAQIYENEVDVEMMIEEIKSFDELKNKEVKKRESKN